MAQFPSRYYLVWFGLEIDLAIGRTATQYQQSPSSYYLVWFGNLPGNWEASHTVAAVAQQLLSGLVWKLTWQLGGQPHNSRSLPAAIIWFGLV